jgi:ERCC4-type nuclease
MKSPIHNIFSSSPTEKEIPCPNPKIKIIIDTREKQSLVAANAIEQKANIKFEKLEIGDYLINDTIIERKTFSDFISSMLNRRLMPQLFNLKKYPKHFLLIEGFYYNYNSDFVHENAIRGMLLSIATDFQIPIIYTEGPKDTAKFLITLAKKYEKSKPKTFSLRHNKTEQTFQEKKEFILQGFPGIGPTLSQNLFEKFGTLKEIFKAPKKELEKISNFNENKIDEFLRLIKN